MHDTALETGRLFLERYAAPGGGAVLDVGALDVNGSLRSFAPAGVEYVGIDLEAGPNVDLVLETPHALPFPEARFAATLATSCFEHDPMFWLTFAEMARVTRPGGYIYVSAPSNGWVHRYPMDNWRFYPDSGLSLQQWSERAGWPVILVESFTTRRRGDVWNDCVMVFCRGEEQTRRDRIVDAVPNAMNIRQAGAIDMVANASDATEDQQIMHRLVQMVNERDARIRQLETMLTETIDAINAHAARAAVAA